jgi:hypothetical protein
MVRASPAARAGYHQRAAVGYARLLGADHPGTLTSRNNLASANQAAGDSERAIPLSEHALADCVRVLGDDYPRPRPCTPTSPWHPSTLSSAPPGIRVDLKAHPTCCKPIST